jgi:hypothetical protein
MIFIEDSAPRFFSLYRTVDDLINEYFRVRNTDLARGRRLMYDFDSVDEIKQLIPDTYPNLAILDTLVNNFEEYTQKIDSGGSFKKARIKLSEDKRFQFSFSLASKGLIRIAEYYNADIAKKYPTLYNSTGIAAEDITMVAGVVDLNMVLSKPLANSQAYFYVIINGQEYPLRQQQKGTAKMLEINPSAQLKQVDGGGMYYTEPSFYQDFSLVFSSTFKKSYLELPKKGGNAKMVDLYIPYDMTGQDVDTKITAALALLLASQFFTQARIKVRINIMRPITIREHIPKPSSIVAVTIKDFQDPIDWNNIAVLRGMESSGRAITEMNAAITAYKFNYYDRVGGREEQSIDAYAREMLYDDERSLQKEFGRYKNWMREEVEAGRFKTPLVPKPLMLTFSTEGLRNVRFDESVARGTALPNSVYTQNRIDELNGQIKGRFFEIIDLVDLYYNDKIGDVVKRVKKRFDDEGKSNRDLKDYFLKLAGKLYIDLEPETGLYATPPDELQKARENYSQLLEKLKKEYERKGI